MGDKSGTGIQINLSIIELAEPIVFHSFGATLGTSASGPCFKKPACPMHLARRSQWRASDRRRKASQIRWPVLLTMECWPFWMITPGQIFDCDTRGTKSQASFKLIGPAPIAVIPGSDTRHFATLSKGGNIQLFQYNTTFKKRAT